VLQAIRITHPNMVKGMGKGDDDDNDFYNTFVELSD
jgi:hypothetical protein